jgi:hypothetical protein
VYEHAIWNSVGNHRNSFVSRPTHRGSRPRDSVITLAEELGNGDGLIDVVWDGKHYQMFNQDLRERSEPLD